jgi:hypothetical protein
MIWCSDICIIKHQNKKNMNSKITALLFTLVSITFAASAKNPTPFTVVPSAKTSVYNIYYSSAEAGKVKVSILNDESQLVFTEVLSNVSSFKRPYNFSQLAEGQYTIVIEDKNGKHVDQVNYTMNKVQSFISVVEVANQESKYVLNVTNNGTEEVFVKIFNGATLLHSQALKVTGNFGLVYNLTKIKSPETISFEVTTSNGKTQVINF